MPRFHPPVPAVCRVRGSAAGRLHAGLALAAVVALATPTGAQPAPRSSGDRPSTSLVGASVVSKDAALVGAVDDVTPDGDGRPRQLIIELAGFLGVGEKDVAVPYDGIDVKTTEPRTPLTGQGIYAGSKPMLVTLPVTLEQLLAAPRHEPQPGAAGAPSPNSGTPIKPPAVKTPSHSRPRGRG